MAVSQYVMADVRCAGCGRPFELVMWAVIDVRERPDLLEQIKKGVWWSGRCSYCGEVWEMDAPVLLYRPESPMKLVVNSSDPTALTFLISVLRRNLGSEWRPAIENDVQIVDRDMLGSDDETLHQAFLEDLSSRGFSGQGFALEWPNSVPSDAKSRIMDYLSAATWQNSQRVLEADPGLCDDDSLRHLQALIDNARRSGLPSDQLRGLVEHHTLLTRCSEIGVSAAFSEKMNTGLSARHAERMPTPAEELTSADTKSDGSKHDASTSARPAPHVAESELDSRGSQSVTSDDLPSAVAEGLYLAAQAEDAGSRARYFKSAVEALHREDVPAHVWGLVNFTVANQLLESQDTTFVIRLYHNALQVWTPEREPDLWGQVCTNLAHVYTYIGRHEEALNLMSSVVRVWTGASGPPHAAGAHIELAQAYRTRPGGDPRANLDSAIESWRIAVGDEYLRDHAPSAVANAAEDLADCLIERQVGGVGGPDWQEAIGLYKEAFKSFRRLKSKQDASRVKSRLNAARKYRRASPSPPSGAVDEPADEAIHARLALNNLSADQKANALISALLHNTAIMIMAGDLNTDFFRTLGRRIQDAAEDRELLAQLRQLESELLELAGNDDYFRSGEESARSLADVDTSDPDHRETVEATIKGLVRLAQWLRTRPVGDKTVDLEKAKELLHNAASALRYDSPPDLVARVLSGLAVCYMESSVGHPVDNHLFAVEQLQKALTYVGARDEFARTAASVLLNLGNAMRYLAQDSDQASGALQVYLQAAERTRIAEDQRSRAMIQLNLSKLYAEWPTVVPDALDESIRSAEAAATFFASAKDDDARDHWLTARMNLGMSLMKKAGEVHPSPDRSAGITVLEEVLTQADPSLQPHVAETTARVLARAYEVDGKHPRVKMALLQAINAGEALLGRANTTADQIQRADAIGKYYEALSWMYVENETEPKAIEALVAAENGKARRFLMDLSFDVPPLPPDDFAEIREDFERIATEQREMERSASGLGPTDPGIIQLASQRLKLTSKARDLRTKTLRDRPELAEVLRHYGKGSASWELFSNLAVSLGPAVALVEFLVLNGKVVAFLLKQGLDAPIVLPLEIDLGVLRYRYAEPFIQFKRAGLEGREDPNSAAAWQAFGEVILRPLEEHLTDIALVYFVTDAWLADLPLHALTVRGVPLIERRQVAYAPSLGILSRLRTRRPVPTARRHSISFGYAADDTQADGLFQAEARSVAHLIGAEAVLGEEVRRGRLSREAGMASIIHVSCHAEYSAEDPMASALLLADGRFPARDWLKTPLRADLVSLSACDTGHSSRSSGDEMAGIGRAILTAGASATILTWWRVRAPSTMVWFEHFYQANLEREASVAGAFRAATLELRGESPDPYTWAPFYLLGGSQRNPRNPPP